MLTEFRLEGELRELIVRWKRAAESNASVELICLTLHEPSPLLP